VRSAAEARDAATRLGYPVVFKPIAGAGSADTYELGSDRDLEQVLARTQHVREASLEEFIDGDEFTFDTVCIAGRPAFINVAQYLPKPLIARSNEWISPIITTVRELAQPAVAGGIALGHKVLGALSMGTGFTHMEWFKKPSGEVVFGEIGCRPGGAHLVDQMNYTCDIDLFREWARAVCWQRFEASTRRKYNVAIIFKRAKGQGRISRIVGLREFMRRYGEHVVDNQLLPIGSPRRNWRHTLVSDGFLIVRHPDWRIANELANIAATEITMYAD
jgi:biotin carboxylase